MKKLCIPMLAVLLVWTAFGMEKSGWKDSCEQQCCYAGVDCAAGFGLEKLLSLFGQGTLYDVLKEHRDPGYHIGSYAFFVVGAYQCCDACRNHSCICNRIKRWRAHKPATNAPVYEPLMDDGKKEQ